MGLFDAYKKFSGYDALGHLFGGGNDPSKAAMPYYQQIPDVLKKYMQPYIEGGTSAYNDLTKQYSDLRNDPGSLLARLGKGYTASPGYEFEKTQGLQGINNAAAAGGMLGTAQHQQEAGDLSTNLASKDYGDYLKNALSIWGQGLSGEEDIANKGFQSSEGLASALSQLLQSEGNLKFAGQEGRNKNSMDFLNNLFGLGGAALTAL